MASIRKAKKEFKKNPYYAKRKVFKVIWYIGKPPCRFTSQKVSKYSKVYRIRFLDSELYHKLIFL